jgi:hypothetical protein
MKPSGFAALRIYGDNAAFCIVYNRRIGENAGH